MCAHPIVWCRLFASIRDIPVVGVVESPFGLIVSQDDWQSHLGVMSELSASGFASASSDSGASTSTQGANVMGSNFMIAAYTPFQALQWGWATGREISYARVMAFREQ